MNISAEISAKVTGLDSVFQEVEAVRRKFFGRAGGTIRKAARRSLRRAAQKKKSELTSEELKRFEVDFAQWKAGKLTEKPRRPEKISQPGKPPLLHMHPHNPLKYGLSYAVTDDAMDVVVGPAQTKSILQKLEASRPFMAPALVAVQPSLSNFLQQAAG